MLPVLFYEENLPQKKQYLLTLLSIFFSLGAVVSSLIALFVLPKASCDSTAPSNCDIAGGANDGWRKMLFVLAMLVSKPDKFSQGLPMVEPKCVTRCYGIGFRHVHRQIGIIQAA